MQSFFRAMLDCHDKIYEKRDRKAADIYFELERFLVEGRYSSYKGSNDLARMKLSKKSDTFIATQLGISESTVRNHTRNVSNELYRLFGNSFLSQLSNYRENTDSVDNTMYRVRNKSKNASSYILDDVIVSIKNNQVFTKECKIEDCLQEIDFLKRFSKQFLEEGINMVDCGKLKFLIDVLDGKTGTPEEWVSLVSNISEEESNRG